MQENLTISLKNIWIFQKMYKSVVNYFFGMMWSFSASELSVGYDPYQKETLDQWHYYVMPEVWNRSVEIPECQSILKFKISLN